MTFLAKNKSHSLLTQRGVLKSVFPRSTLTLGGKKLVWTHDVQPSALSQYYKIKVEYVLGSIPDAFVLSPQLSLPDGAAVLPHVYDPKLQQLCLFHPRFEKWKSTDLLAHTIVPWALEWLLHYEIWHATKEWCGGGHAHEKDESDL